MTTAPPESPPAAAPQTATFKPAPPRTAPKVGMPTDGFLVFAGLPKAGKTRLASSIAGGVIIELERGGADRIDGWVQDVHTLAAFREAMKWAIAEPKVRVIVIDTIDEVLELLEEGILEKYELGSMMDRREGVNTWQELRKQVNAMVKRFKDCGKLVVGLAHYKEPKLDSDGRIVLTQNLNAPGKIGPYLCAQADLIGNCSKGKVGSKTQYTVTFQGGGSLGTFGSRIDELEGKTVVIPKRNGWAAIEAACKEGALEDAPAQEEKPAAAKATAVNKTSTNGRTK